MIFAVRFVNLIILNMFYPSNIHEPEDGLRMVLEAVNKFSVSTFLYAIRDREKDVYEIERFATHIAEKRSVLEREYIALKEVSQTFNKEYVTNYNKRFSLSLKLLKELKNSLRETRSIYQRYAPTVHRSRDEYKRNDVDIPNIHDVSLLRSDNYISDIFGVESYPVCVSGLFHEMEKFFNIMQKSIELCLYIILQERKYRRNVPKMVSMYNKQKAKVNEEVDDMIRYIGDITKLNNDTCEIYASFKMCDGDIEKFAPAGFHNWTPREFTRLQARLGLEKLKEAQIDDLERAIWGTDVKQVALVRSIIKRFDELLPDGFNNKKLPAPLVAMFMIWTKADEKQWKNFIKYFKKKYAEFGGKFVVPGYTGVIKAKNNLANIEDTDLYKNLVDKIMNLPSIPEHIPEIAAVG